MNDYEITIAFISKVIQWHYSEYGFKDHFRIHAFNDNDSTMDYYFNSKGELIDYEMDIYYI